MESTYPESGTRSKGKWFDRLLGVTSRLRDYPIAASSIFCIVVIVLSHAGQVPPDPAAGRQHHDRFEAAPARTDSSKVREGPPARYRPHPIAERLPGGSLAGQ